MFNVDRKRIREWQRANAQLQAPDKKRKRLEEGGVENHLMSAWKTSF